MLKDTSMPTKPHELDALIQSILSTDEEEEPAATIDLDAALADPVLRALIDRTMRPYQPLLSPKGREHARRTLALHFTTDPQAVALLAEMRKHAASGAEPIGNLASEPRPRTKKS